MQTIKGPGIFLAQFMGDAANMDGLIELSCGALSINPEIAVDSARSLFLPEERTYLTYDEMISKEAALPADKKNGFCNNCYSQLRTLCSRDDGT